MTPGIYEDVKEEKWKFFGSVEGSLEIKRRSWEDRMTQSGKKESQVGS